MSTRPEPVTTPIHLLSELPKGTTYRHSPSGTVRTLSASGHVPIYVKVVAWPEPEPEPEPEPKRVPWHQAMGNPTVADDGTTIKPTDAHCGTPIILTEIGRNSTVTADADGMVTVHEPEPTSQPEPVERVYNNVPADAWWVSWYSSVDLGSFELHSPWWISGYRDDDYILCAAVLAPSGADAYGVVAGAYDDGRPADFAERFCEPLRGSPFTSRWPQAAWMKWDPAGGVTCGCDSCGGNA